MEVLRADPDTPMSAVEAEVRRIRPGVGQTADDVQTIRRRLPDAPDRPSTRVMDTLTSSQESGPPGGVLDSHVDARDHHTRALPARRG